MTLNSETSSDNSGNIDVNDNQAVISDFASAESIQDISTLNLPANCENAQTYIPITQSPPIGVRPSLSSDHLSSDSLKSLNRSDELFNKGLVKGSSFETASTTSFGSNIPHITGRHTGEKRTAFASFAKEATLRYDSRMNVDGRHVFTVRRDLPTYVHFMLSSLNY
jgi:hypothetical protein